MSFPERLILGHLIDGENDKDAVTSQDRRADTGDSRNLDELSTARTEAAAASAAGLDGDTGR